MYSLPFASLSSITPAPFSIAAVTVFVTLSGASADSNTISRLVCWMPM